LPSEGNLGPAQIRLRWITGLAGLLGGVVVFVVVRTAPHGIRALLFLPFFFGALGVLQAREKT
jgi:hypothetical protein